MNNGFTETAHKNELIQTIWDLFKDVHGVRPRGMDYDRWSVTDLEWEVAMLSVHGVGHMTWLSWTLFGSSAWCLVVGWGIVAYNLGK